MANGQQLIAKNMITRAEILDIKSLATKQGREELGAFIAEG